MLTSGQFAVMGNVGRKALRLYREEGLLVPALTSDENGYHYYDEEQLATLEIIKRLRGVGLSLFEIKQILAGEVDEKVIVKSKIKETDKLLNDMKDMLSDKEKMSGNEQMLDIDIKEFAECICLFVDENVDLEKLGMSVGKLYEKAARLDVEVGGSHFVQYKGMSDEKEFSMRTCLPVLNYKNDDTVDVFENKCLHIRFSGGFSKVSQVHKRMNDYIIENNIKTNGRVYEVYNKDMSVDVYYSVE